ncbi:DUF4329 domain-containing protein [Rhizobium phaseoli]|uniref:DUF4329 domain-containing protein n=1 Tax=Rhizobium phaseoli TaxID=396 RepID=UPI0007EA045D|nr:DUF4329 domain-containing protein [Rhizobium phaseoli]
MKYAHKLLLYFYSSIVLGLSSCEANETQYSPKADDVSVLAKLVLEQVQASAIKENIEYCGYITQDPRGDLKIVGPAKGTTFDCRTPLVYAPDKIVASFHDHGALDPRVLTEMPSTTDFDAVQVDRADAYIGTPGGRLWHVDWKKQIARIICGPENCLLKQSPLSPETHEELPPKLSRTDVEAIEKRSNKSNRR